MKRATIICNIEAPVRNGLIEPANETPANAIPTGIIRMNNLAVRTPAKRELVSSLRAFLDLIVPEIMES